MVQSKPQTSEINILWRLPGNTRYNMSLNNGVGDLCNVTDLILLFPNETIMEDKKGR